ncbi:hypothetical protein [Thermosipho melanesiensis]|uniref:Uncharacterized protein n=1 Tax=Thermosipho melanesiensis (strain DSM 12029 / CIP 104789 / BI429) TaxID=391009 RepID=A6LMF2_THEM4|nr:hypothetical protein [Thermosipho melanesiensis]ABR31103.1 hypothetical protein Tmel_1252 [Thermosipho melanesiensis BI429]
MKKLLVVLLSLLALITLAEPTEVHVANSESYRISTDITVNVYQ